MSNHEHEFAILNGVLRCKTCGAVGNTVMEKLATQPSLRQARRIQDEIAADGGWEVTGTNEHAAIYRRVVDGITEELMIEKKGARTWMVIKTVSQE